MMRWEGTGRWGAARLKNATDRCDRLNVTFTLSSRSTNRPGGGRKSSTILTRPISPLLYLTAGFFIDRLSFPPVTGPENPDLLVSPRKAHRYDGALDPANTEVALLLAAMIEVFGDHAQRVQKRMLSELKPDAMLGPIGLVLGSVPFEIGHRHVTTIWYVEHAILLYGRKGLLIPPSAGLPCSARRTSIVN